MKKLILLHIVLFLNMVHVNGQISKNAARDSLKGVIPNEVSEDSTNLQFGKEKKIIKRVGIWKTSPAALSEIIATDSLMRWEYLSEWGDVYAYRRDVFAYRLGTTGRADAFSVKGYDFNDQSIFFEHIRLNNPVTGRINYNLVPVNKIMRAEELYSTRLVSRIEAKNYYITKPVSYLNYDEGAADFRNLEFMVSQNTAPTTNIEISYRDRREGGTFQRSGVTGSQIYGKLYHHMGEKYQLRTLFMRNQYNNEEPFGYQIVDMGGFNFDEFATTPVERAGKSRATRSDISIGMYGRADTLHTESSGLVVTRTVDDYTLTFGSDTLFWDLTEYNASLFKGIRWGRLGLRGDLDGYYTAIKDSSSVDRKSWAGYTAGLNADLRPITGVTLSADGKVYGRNDDFSGAVFSGGMYINGSALNFKIIAAYESRMPEMQELYWKSRNYAGNRTLNNEHIFSLFGSFDVHLGRFVQLGAHTRYKKIENEIRFSEFNILGNGSPAELLNGTIFGKIDVRNFELESSATAEFTLDKKILSGGVPTDMTDTKLWLRNSAYVKGYVFDRSAYIKTGVSTVFSPFSYYAPYYNSELGNWQKNFFVRPVPAFFRMDAELSARVRAIMVVLRWENVLDGFGQAGYFETASYPMWPRRLLVGIRAKFRN